MARVDVDIEQDEEPAGAQFAEEEPEAGPSRRGGRRKRRDRERVDVEIEREVTKRQLIETVSSVLVVILYMLFTLLRERDAGVIVLDDEADDWDEG